MKAVANGRVVRARSARQVEVMAAEARESLGLSPEDRVSMTPLLEQVLYDLIPGYDFRVEDDRDMGGLDGLTDDKRPVIHIKNSVYSSLQKGDARARMTMAHEFGHLLMHCGMPTYRAFSEKYEPLYDPERQANIFAAAFLMPRQAFIKCRTAKQAMKKFGVSLDAALCRARKLSHRFQQDRPILTVAKKKGCNKRRTP